MGKVIEFPSGLMREDVPSLQAAVEKHFGVKAVNDNEPSVFKRIAPPQNKYQFLQQCKAELTVEDYEEMLCSIMDVEYFNVAEEDIRLLVESYFDYQG